MINREEASRLRKEFWTAFGRYMTPVPSAEGMKINWINYRTTIKDVYFRMDADAHGATIAITIEHNDPGIRELYFGQFIELKPMLHTSLMEEWQWQARFSLMEGREISRIHKHLPAVSIFNKDHWPELISFFKPRIIALDQFWENAKYSFEALK